MTSDRLCYWVAAVILGLGLSHSVATHPGVWMVTAGEQASSLVQRISGTLLNPKVATRLAISRQDCPHSAMQAQFAAMQMAMACRRTEMLRLQTQMDNLPALQAHSHCLRQTLSLPSRDITVEVPQFEIPGIRVRKLPAEGTI